MLSMETATGDLDVSRGCLSSGPLAAAQEQLQEQWG